MWFKNSIHGFGSINVECQLDPLVGLLDWSLDYYQPYVDKELGLTTERNIDSLSLLNLPIHIEDGKCFLFLLRETLQLVFSFDPGEQTRNLIIDLKKITGDTDKQFTNWQASEYLFDILTKTFLKEVSYYILKGEIPGQQVTSDEESKQQESCIATIARYVSGISLQAIYSDLENLRLLTEEANEYIQYYLERVLVDAFQQLCLLEASYSAVNAKGQILGIKPIPVSGLFLDNIMKKYTRKTARIRMGLDQVGARNKKSDLKSNLKDFLQYYNKIYRVWNEAAERNIATWKFKDWQKDWKKSLFDLYPDLNDGLTDDLIELLPKFRNNKKNPTVKRIAAEHAARLCGIPKDQHTKGTLKKYLNKAKREF